MLTCGLGCSNRALRQAKLTGTQLSTLSIYGIGHISEFISHCTLCKKFQSLIIYVQSFHTSLKLIVPSHFVIIVLSINSYQTNFSNIESKLYTHFLPIPFLPAFALTLHYTPNKHIQLTFKILKMWFPFIIFKHLFDGHSSINKITINHLINKPCVFFFVVEYMYNLHPIGILVLHRYIEQ